MNRRQFNLSLASLATAPLVPALPAKAAVAAVASPLDPAQMYLPWAVRYARVHGACSADKIASTFRIAPEVARTIMTRMQASGIIAAPGLGGLAKALDPINFDLQLAGRAAAEAQAVATRKATQIPGFDQEEDVEQETEEPVEEETLITEDPAEET